MAISSGCDKCSMNGAVQYVINIVHVMDVSCVSVKSLYTSQPFLRILAKKNKDSSHVIEAISVTKFRNWRIDTLCFPTHWSAVISHFYTSFSNIFHLVPPIFNHFILISPYFPSIYIDFHLQSISFHFQQILSNTIHVQPFYVNFPLISFNFLRFFRFQLNFLCDGLEATRNPNFGPPRGKFMKTAGMKRCDK